MPRGRKAARAAAVEDEGEDAETVELCLDEHGRVQGTSDCGLDFAARAWRLRLSGARDVEAQLAADCDEIFDGVTTFWLPATARPRCTLERLARAVFEHHTQGATFDAARSGCEFWAQVRERPAVAPSSNAGVLSASPAMIRFHWFPFHVEKNEKKEEKKRKKKKRKKKRRKGGGTEEMK